MNAKNIIIYDKEDMVIFKGRIIALNLKEELIINMSIEYFNDPSPCFIHRSAVMKRLFVELEDYLESSSDQGKSEWKMDEIPENIKNILSAYDTVNKIQYKI